MRRDRAMSPEPSLATSWEALEDGKVWRFHLPEGVKFHEGQEFTVKDVVSGYGCASAPEADTASWFEGATSVEEVDEHTVDITTETPNPVFPESIANWMKTDSGWAEENGAELPNIAQGNYATLTANGTGPYRINGRQPGLKTTPEAFDGW